MALPAGVPEGDNGAMGNSIERRQRSTLSKLDDALLVGVVVVVALVGLQLLSWVIGTVWFLVKVAAVAAVAALAWTWVSRRN
jgi:hypothetical protein